jgi:hypothetical protein
MSQNGSNNDKITENLNISVDSTGEVDFAAILEDYNQKHHITYPLGQSLPVIEIDQDQVNDELIEECIDRRILADVASGVLLSHPELEHQQRVINEIGIEDYLRGRLENDEVFSEREVCRNGT